MNFSLYIEIVGLFSIVILSKFIVKRKNRMSKMNKWLLSSGLFGLLLALSGCVSTNADGTPKETGMIYRFW